jgi:hypothetical protein
MLIILDGPIRAQRSRFDMHLSTAKWLRNPRNKAYRRSAGHCVGAGKPLGPNGP